MLQEPLKRKTHLSIALALVFFFVIYPLLVDAEASYLVFLFYTAFMYVTLSQGWNIAAGYAGQVSLGQHAFFGIGCYVTAITWRAGTAGYLDPLAMLMSGAGAAVVAIVVGLPLLAKLRGDYFALGTLGLGEILRVAALNGGSFTEGAAGISIPSDVYQSIKPYYFIALLISVLTMLSLWFIAHSRIGLALVAIREDETAASANGIPILRYKILAFTLGAFVTGLCGSLNAYFVFHIDTAGAFNLNWVIMPILMVILGGVGTFVGPVLGVFSLIAAFELIRLLTPQLHPIFSGAFIILVTLFLPDGIMSYLTGHKNRLLHKLSPFKWLALNK
ncbi:MAG: branched-chain amino acid ABC transporter permease [Deltaproteobacteria bacterium]|nr:branched-chain amino acid ABC transporter permease [Deltaproteobacteria bacterium]MBW1919495.1 branched-chain amino acid ABC transporter permease [Deltaproteobacteria bacterium]MBW1934776.1 branched-chain amino acid ABC transporter permease [Deltaproteobacteria bacterium]MBW2044916.1 branched-chain amino acid ABC transporter permease [Deltaproteobacteria bacterium]RLB35541.1 MAG: branched-chain amino acid ABC transporter permease [Deltaproteobacteria bacterium]